jgi:transcriptional regulator with XRE-family HTH domain
MWVSKKIQDRIDESKKTDRYWVEKAKLDYALELDKFRKISGLTGKTLAQKLGTSAAYISRVFRGDTNLTIESMVKLSRATGGKLDIKIIDQNAKVDSSVWIGIMHNLKAANQAKTPIKTMTTVEEFGEAA